MADVRQADRSDLQSAPAAGWGSDVVARLLRAFDLPYLCLNPGSSLRGIHDSVVNYLGNRNPELLLCLHEEHAVAIAHGWAKVTGRPLGVMLHANVGLMHASMAIYNAWCDRMPMIILGATGPVDAAKRRPWCDWIHTTRDTAALVRHYVKWDDQPASVAAVQESLLRAAQIASTPPRGPVYICLDTALQEAKVDVLPAMPDPGRFRAPVPSPPASELVDRAAQWLREARHPVILMGRVSRDEHAWRDRVELTEQLGATALTDLRIGAAFPTDHPLHGGPAGLFLMPDAAAALRMADVVLSLDWVDLAGTLKQAWGDGEIPARVIQVSLDQFVHNGWAMDHQALPPTDLYLLSEPDPAVAALLAAVRFVGRPARLGAPRPVGHTQTVVHDDASGGITLVRLVRLLREVSAGEPVSLLHLATGWPADLWPFRHPLDYVGYDGGGGIGSGPGIAVGAALALKGTGRLPIATIGDGDYLMGLTALWTAAAAKVPLLVVVVNNQSYFNDELHQEHVARERGRPVENRWVGQRIANPALDIAALARGQGLLGIGPVETPEGLVEALAEAVGAVKRGAASVVDVRLGTARAEGEAVVFARKAGAAT